MKTIRIFISSPSDVATERDKARQVIADLQKRYVGNLLLEPFFWEDLPLRSDTSFQVGIDYLLSVEGGVDIAVFILWSRLGSPLGPRIRKADGSEYLSGTEREWDLMLQAREASGGTRPDIFTYVREDQDAFIETQRGKDQPQLLEMVLQHGKVKNFIIEHFTDRKTGTNTRAYFTFKEPIVFAHRLRTHLRTQLDKMLVDADLSAVVWNPAEQGSPFRGLEVFEYEHATLFFGREQEICDLQIRLRQQNAAGCAFVLLVGASGSGKSSLARAGVAPAVAQYDREDEAAEWRRAVFTPGESKADLLLGFVRALAAPHALPELAGENLTELAADLARGPEMTFRHKLRPLFTGTRRLLLVFDQIEELFTHGEISAEAQRQLSAVLSVLARSGDVWVLGTVRTDYYARFQALPELLALKGEGAQVDLSPPTVSELQRIIIQPARAAGLRFEENERGEPLDARLLADATAHPEALPLLEFCLDALYQRQTARNDGVLRWADYETMRTFPGPDDATPSSRAESGLAGALVTKAEEALASLPAEHQARCFSAIFGKLLDFSAGERELPVRKTALEEDLVRNPYHDATGQGEAELPGARAFLVAFAERRLLVSGVASAAEGHDPQRTFVVVHEALLRNWPRLRQLQAEQAEFFRTRRQVERAHADWLGSKDDSFLLSEGLPLQSARKLAAEAPELLTRNLADYIEHSTTRSERIRHRRRKVAVAVMAGLILLTTLAVVAAALAMWQRSLAFAAQKNAETQRAAAAKQQELAEEKEKQARLERDISRRARASADQFIKFLQEQVLPNIEESQKDSFGRIIHEKIQNYLDETQSDPADIMGIVNRANLFASRAMEAKARGSYVDALRLLQSAERLTAQFLSKPDEFAPLISLHAQILRHQAAVTDHSGQHDFAFTLIQNAEGEAQDLTQRFPMVGSYAGELNAIRIVKGRLLLSMGKKPEAVKAFKDSIATLSPFAKGDNLAGSVVGLATAYHELIALLVETNPGEDEKVIMEWEKLMQAMKPNRAHLKDWSGACIVYTKDLIDSLGRRGSWNRVIEEWERLIALLKQDHAAEPSPTIVEDLYKAYTESALVAREKLGKQKEEERLLVAMVADLVATTNGATQTQELRILAFANSSLGDFYRTQTDDGAKAEGPYHAALAVMERAAKGREETAESFRDLAIAHQRLGLCLAQLKRYAEADIEHKQEIELAVKATQKDTDNLQYVHDIMIGCLNRANVLLALWSERKREQDYELAQAIVKIGLELASHVPEAAKKKEGIDQAEADLKKLDTTLHTLARDENKTRALPAPTPAVRPSTGPGSGDRDAEMLFTRGDQLRKGDGLPRDFAAALDCFRRAAALGHAGAQHRLGVMYATGDGVSKSDTEAVKWYRLAADQGFAEAQYDLGVRYMLGKGVLKDERTGLEWYRKAAAQGYQEAVDALRQRGLR